MIAPTDLPPRRQDHCTVADCGPRWNEPACIPSACPCPHHEAHECPVCGQDNDPSGPGCACYGIPTPLPHHPTSAELAAFRGWSGYCRTCGPLHHMDYPATRWERTYGTVRETGQRDHDSDPARHSLARREASAMRSRAYIGALHRR